MAVTHGERRLALSQTWRKQAKLRISQNWDLYLIILIPVIYFTIFHYAPMYGVQIAFRDFQVARTILESEWVGLAHFRRFFDSFLFWRILWNTVYLSLYGLVAGFPIPIILAISLHYAVSKRFKKVVQMITYAPHFISTVVLVGMILQVLHLRIGLLNGVRGLFGADPVNYLGRPELFGHVHVWSDVWRGMGWGSIVYLAALAGVDPQMHEAAIVDGATKVQRIWHIDIPSIMPTAVILLILNVGRILFLGFEKILLLQNPLNLTASEIIQTYVYKVGLQSAIPQYSYSSAIGLFASLVSFALLIAVNRIAKRVGETSLW